MVYVDVLRESRQHLSAEHSSSSIVVLYVFQEHGFCYGCYDTYYSNTIDTTAVRTILALFWWYPKPYTTTVSQQQQNTTRCEIHQQESGDVDGEALRCSHGSNLCGNKHILEACQPNIAVRVLVVMHTEHGSLWDDGSKIHVFAFYSMPLGYLVVRRSV